MLRRSRRGILADLGYAGEPPRDELTAMRAILTALSALPVCVVVALDVVISGTNTWVSLAAAGVWLVAVVYLLLSRDR